MSAIPQKKLCSNCEGNVSWEEEDCPYCGVYLKEPYLEKSSKDQRQTPIISALNPPYRLEQALTTGIPRSPFDLKEEEEEPEGEEPFASPMHLKSPNTLWPLVLLLTGSLSLVFGLILFLFAKDGVLILRWNGDYWYLYLLTALPLLLTGWNVLKRLDQ